MSLFKKLFGKGKKKINLQVTEVGEEKPKPKPNRTGTTLRKPEESTAPPQKKEGPELTALEMAQRKDWKIKSLSVWEPGDVILDTYEVEDVISGGMGHVYIANHNKWNVKLAIKSPNEMMLSDRDFFARILREANSWTELGLHPNIAYCYFVRNIEDVPHIVVEYVDGGNLRQWIEDGKCIDYRANLDLAIQFCHGMEYAHSKGMVHRDIKSANVLMTKDGTLKITDFGLVRDQGPGAGDQVSGVRSEEEGRKTVDHGLTTVGTFMGTPGYISPEQAEDPTKVDERSDIFSFGVCLYEMFCGNKPYGVTYGEKQDAPDPVELSHDENFPIDIGKILKKTIQWNPSARYKDFKEIRQELTGVYFDLFGERSRYAEMELLDLEADGLNNRGVSYFELGKKGHALSCWGKALEINTTHIEATYNLSLVEWRDGKMYDSKILRRLENCENNPSADKEKLSELKAFIHAERFDLDAAKDVLKMYPGRYEVLFSGYSIDQISLINTIKGHTAAVRSVAITRDDRYVVSGGVDNTLRVWELGTGRCALTLEGHTAAVRSIAITRDGRYAVSGGHDNTLRVWELETGRCALTLEGHIDAVYSVALTPDGNHAVSGGVENTLRVWDLGIGQCELTLEGHTNSVSSVAITPDGRYAVSGSVDKTIRLWELKTGQCVRTIEVKAYVFTLAITPDGRYAVSGTEDKNLLRLWELESGRCIRTSITEDRGEGVHSLAITPDGRYAVSGSYRSFFFRLWDLETGQCVRTIKEHTKNVTTVAITHDNRYALSGCLDGNLRVWKLSLEKAFKSELKVSIPKGIEERTALDKKVKHSEEFFTRGDYKTSFSVLFGAWKETGFSDIEDIKEPYSRLIKKGKTKGLPSCFQRKLLIGHTDLVSSLSITSDGRHAVSGSWDGTLRVWELKTGRCLRVLKGHSDIVNTVTLTPDGRYVVSGSNDKTIRLWEPETGRCIRTMKGHAINILSVSISSDGRYAISGGEGETLEFWELGTGSCKSTMRGHTSFVNSVALTPDGRYAVSGGIDRVLRLWEPESGRCMCTMEGHTRAVLSVALTPDGRYAISGSEDKTMRVWELETGRCVRAMKENIRDGAQGYQQRYVYSVNITSDGRYAVSGSVDRRLWVWELETGRCIRTMEGHDRMVHSVALTPDGRYAVSGSRDNTLRLWEFIWDLDFT